jgi:hypothetical protein
MPAALRLLDTVVVGVEPSDHPPVGLAVAADH